MNTAQPLARCNLDGSVEVWFDGWHIVFPAEGRPDTPTIGDPPDKTGDVAGVTASRVGKAIGIRFGDWVALVGDGTPRIVSAEPERNSNADFLYRLYDRRAG
jgi:hypothetical protein